MKESFLSLIRSRKMNKLNKIVSSFDVTRTEIVTYALYFFAQNIIYSTFGGHITLYWSFIGIEAATIALIVLIAKIWDAINDPIFGVYVDNHKFKNGDRFFPWLKISAGLIAITTAFGFLIPRSDSQVLMIVLSLLSYVLWDISYTMCDVPIYAMPLVITDDLQKRTKVNAAGRLGGVLGATVVTVGYAAIVDNFGYLVSGVALAAIGGLLMIPFLLKGKERIHEKEITTGDRYTFKDMWKALIQNKYLFIVCISSVIFGLSQVENILSVYVGKYCLGNTSLGTVIAAFIALPLIVVALFIPKLTKKFDKFLIYMVCVAGIGVCSIAMFFTGYSSLIVFCVLMFFKGCFLGGTSIIGMMFIHDAIEYGAYKTGRHNTGVSLSIQTFSNKIRSALASSIPFAILALFSFVEGEPDVQPQTAVDGIWFTFTIIPAIGSFATLIFFSFYKLRDKAVQVMVQYNEGHITKEEADAKLEEKYGPAYAEYNE